MSRYEIIDSRHWKHASGATASLYGAVPWSNEADRVNWRIVIVGYTVRDNVRGTVGIGRKPFETYNEAETWVYEQNKRLGSAKV
jgi:hypothetical protein